VLLKFFYHLHDLPLIIFIIEIIPLKNVSFFSFLNLKLSSIKNDPTICMILHFIVCTAYSEIIKATFIMNIDTWFYNRKMPQMSQNSLFFIIFFTYGMCLAPNTHTFQQHFHTFHSYTWIFIYLHPITTSVTLW